jgi:hypothetical protein
VKYINKKQIASAAEAGIPEPKQIRQNVTTDDAWATRALLAIYAHQTAYEQSAGATTEDNGVGFSGTDAEFLSSVASQAKRGRQLSEKQMVYVRKRMGKYANQLFWIAVWKKEGTNNG